MVPESGGLEGCREVLLLCAGNSPIPRRAGHLRPSQGRRQSGSARLCRCRNILRYVNEGPAGYSQEAGMATGNLRQSGCGWSPQSKPRCGLLPTAWAATIRNGLRPAEARQYLRASPTELVACRGAVFMRIHTFTGMLVRLHAVTTDSATSVPQPVPRCHAGSALRVFTEQRALA